MWFSDWYIPPLDHCSYPGKNANILKRDVCVCVCISQSNQSCEWLFGSVCMQNSCAANKLRYICHQSHSQSGFVSGVGTEQQTKYYQHIYYSKNSWLRLKFLLSIKKSFVREWNILAGIDHHSDPALPADHMTLLDYDS